MPGCGKKIHANRLCWTHDAEARGGYKGHGKRSKILPKPGVTSGGEGAKAGKRVGADLGRPKITQEIADEIRARYEAGGESYASLAEEYGISRSRVRDIIKGRAWKA